MNLFWAIIIYLRHHLDHPEIGVHGPWTEQFIAPSSLG